MCTVRATHTIITGSEPPRAYNHHHVDTVVSSRHVLMPLEWAHLRARLMLKSVPWICDIRATRRARSSQWKRVRSCARWIVHAHGTMVDALGSFVVPLSPGLSSGRWWFWRSFDSVGGGSGALSILFAAVRLTEIHLVRQRRRGADDCVSVRCSSFCYRMIYWSMFLRGVRRFPQQVKELL